LYRPRGRHHDHPVGVAISPGFQQQRNIQHGKGFSSEPNPPQEGSLFLPDYGMQNALELAQGIRLSQHSVTQRNPIHRPVQHGTRKSRLNGRHRAATPRLQSVHSGISVKDRDAGATKHRRGSRLPHPDPAGQPDDLHAPVVRSAVTKSRSS
jgi:hypothetical protein